MTSRQTHVLLTLLLLTTPLCAQETALDRYVRKPDPTYEWKVVNEVKGDGVTQFVVDMKSQKWRTEKDVNRPVWQHWVNIAKPDQAVSDTALLFISGGGNGGQPPQSADARTLQIAKATNTVAIELRMVPNQPLIFHGDGKPRVEDDLIGYSWDQFLKTGDETWPARLPMVKSAVRAMDCVQELLGSDRGGKVRIAKFVVAGGSKRGWTTWCTAAVDKRVVAIVPLVIDVLNVTQSMKHHAGAYGFYAEAVSEYLDHNIMQRLNDPRSKQLYAIEDPFSYRNRLTMPKLIVNAGGDQFFCPDSSQFYFGALKGEKYLRYVPNANHSLGGTDALESLIAFYQAVLADKPRPKFSWRFEKSGAIRVRTQTSPRQVLLWRATNPKTRDFRVDTIGRAYTSQVLTDQGGGVFVGQIDPPKEGWTAFFIELTFDTGGTYPLKLTTAVRVLPDVLPHANLDPATVPRESKPR